MPKIKPGVLYSAKELRELISQEEATQLAFQGYVLAYDATIAKYKLVKWQESAMRGGAGERPRERATVLSDAFGDLPPIVRRDPQERVNSLMLKWLDECLRTNSVPGVDSSKVKEILGEAWKVGMPITAEDVRTIAAHFLQKAENKRKAENYNKVVADGPLG